MKRSYTGVIFEYTFDEVKERLMESCGDIISDTIDIHTLTESLVSKTAKQMEESIGDFIVELGIPFFPAPTDLAEAMEAIVNWPFILHEVVGFYEKYNDTDFTVYVKGQDGVIGILSKNTTLANY